MKCVVEIYVLHVTGTRVRILYEFVSSAAYNFFFSFNFFPKPRRFRAIFFRQQQSDVATTSGRRVRALIYFPSLLGFDVIIRGFRFIRA